MKKNLQLISGELYDVSCCPELVKGLLDPSVDEEFTEDIWGIWISGYAPIYSDSGETLGIVGVDISIDTWIRHKNILIQMLVLAISTTLVFILLFSFVSFFLYLRESEKIAQALTIRNEKLESEVKKRTELLQQFMATVVHEIRSPLTSIRWMIEEFQTKKQTKKSAEELSDMHTLVLQILRLVGEFLDVTKLNVGKFSIKLKKDNLSAVLVESISPFKTEAEMKGIDLHADIPKKLSPIKFDRKRIQQVMTNLLSNALKFTDEGSIHIEVQDQNAVIHVEITDTGIGMNSEQIQKLFQPFVRVHETDRVGTGLGLVIAKGIVEQHGGELNVISKKDGGSTFWFTLPKGQ